MTLHEILKRTEKLAIDNSPTILASVSVAGTLATAFLFGKATLRADQIVRDEQERLDMHEKSHPLERKEILKLVWKEYIPAVGCCALTIGSIVMANRIGNRRAAAMAMAFTLSERRFLDYSSRVVEKIGDKKEREIRDEVAQDRVDRHPVNSNEVIITGDGEVLFFDDLTARYFLSTMETVKKAVNDTNYRVMHDGYASLTDFYNRVGLDRCGISDDIGWNADKMLEVTFSTCLSKDQKPAVSIIFLVAPLRGFDRFDKML